jgi:hypothetical protein
VRAAAILLALAALAGCGDRSYPVAAQTDGSAVAVRSPDGLPETDFGLRRDGGGEGGASTCVPQPETCNQIDDDCDGIIDDGFELKTDPQNCGLCGVVCSYANASPTCVAGKCKLGACLAASWTWTGCPKTAASAR